MTDPPAQPELALSLPSQAGSEVPLLPARMVNEFVYCPRLAYLEWVQGEWADSADTVEGRSVHRRADQARGSLPEASALDEAASIHARSVTLSSEALGVIAKLDLVESEAGTIRPVDYKRGRRPHVERSAHLPERVQLGLQILLLREHGYACEEGILYFAGSRERVPVALDEELHRQVLAAVNGLRLLAASGRIPPPLEDSPKCPRCSLVGICLPDEVAWLRAGRIEPRPLAVARTEALPLIVQDGRARIGKSGETLEVSAEGERLATARLAEVSQVVLYGHATLTTPALHELMRREIPVSWMSHGGWFVGHTVGLGHRNVEVRMHQWQRSFDPAFCLRLARSLVAAKIRNARTLIRRNWRGEEAPEALLAALDRDRADAEAARDLKALLGIEGLAARRCFEGFAGCLAPGAVAQGGFAWDGRNRRPPTDPLNALLSFAYAMLVRAWTVQLSAVGLDPYRGFYHQPRYGRPALALDMMEPFRPLVADSAVLMAINNGEVGGDDFIRRAGAVALTPAGRKAMIAAFERRLDQEITHPVFGYRVSYRRLFEVQARLLGRFLAGEIPELPQITPR
jgi:CRISPR-associated endonuclease Cas1/CRISPR-associated protein Cas4